MDSLIDKLMRTYTNAYAMHDYPTACQMLFQMNALLSSDCKITDMKQFKILDHTYESTIHHDSRAQIYCDLYAPLVMSAISAFNEKVIDKILLDNEAGF